MVVLKGKMEQSDILVLRHKIEALNQGSDYKTAISLDSPGGDSTAGIFIGNYVRTNQWITTVPPHKGCLSACAIIWLSGVKRYLSSRSSIGFHSIAFATDPSKRNDNGNDIVGAYLRAIDVPEILIQRIYKTPPTSMDYMYRSEAIKLGLLGNPPTLDFWPLSQ